MKHQPSAIQYIALLDNRQQMLFNNVPPTTIVHPLLRYLGNLPQHMGHFIYGCDYHAIALGNKLQLGTILNSFILTVLNFYQRLINQKMTFSCF